MKRIDDLDSPLNTASELEGYLKKIRDLYKELYLEVSFAAELLQQNLATLPVANSRMTGGVAGSANSRVRAKLVADNLRRIAESNMYCGGQAVKTWRQFTKTFAPEIEATRMKNPKQPQFRVDA
jgi:hypothetical protein